MRLFVRVAESRQIQVAPACDGSTAKPSSRSRVRGNLRSAPARPAHAPVQRRRIRVARRAISVVVAVAGTTAYSLPAHNEGRVSSIASLRFSLAYGKHLLCGKENSRKRFR